jgi:hypothetical protein
MEGVEDRAMAYWIILRKEDGREYSERDSSSSNVWDSPSSVPSLLEL